MNLYKLPLGIRILENNEYPIGYNVKTINEKRDQANIIQGFTIREVSGEKFSHYVEVNIDVDKIWDIFSCLANIFSDDISYGILKLKDKEPILSNFTKAERLVEIFEKYKFELTNDGFLEFGIARNNEDSLDEILVSSFKYMRIWTTKKEAVVETLNRFGIEEIEMLQFIDEFPVVSEALSSNIYEGIRHYSEVMKCIDKEFEKICDRYIN